MSTGPDERRILFLSANAIKTPPFSAAAGVEAGGLLRLLQRGATLAMPHSRPMPSIGPGCHELRVRDEAHNWRVFYRVETDSIVVIGTSPKTTRATPKRIIDVCKRRLKRRDAQ